MNIYEYQGRKKKATSDIKAVNDAGEKRGKNEEGGCVQVSSWVIKFSCGQVEDGQMHTETSLCVRNSFIHKHTLLDVKATE